MLRIVPLFVVVMLATIALIGLVSACVVGVNFLFSNKRRTFGVLFAGFILSIITCVVLFGALLLNQRYKSAAYHARAQYELNRSQTELQRQVPIEVLHDGFPDIVVDRPTPPTPVSVPQPADDNSLAVSLEKEQRIQNASQPVIIEEQIERDDTADEATSVVNENLEENGLEGELTQNDHAAASEPEHAAVSDSADSSDEAVSSDIAAQSTEEGVSAVAQLDDSLAAISSDTPTIITTQVEDIMPDWCKKGERLTEWQGVTAKVVTSDKSDPRLRRLELKLKTRNACVDQTMELQEEMGIDVSRMRVTDEMMQACQRESYTVTQPLPGGGTQDKVHQLLVFDERFRGYVKDAVKNREITQRLQTTTILSGMVLSSVTLLYGTFSFLAYWRRPKSA